MGDVMGIEQQRRRSILIISGSADARLAEARRWIGQRPAGEQALVVAPSALAANDLLRGAVIAGAADRAGAASFGWYRETLGRLAFKLAEPQIAREGLTPVGNDGVAVLVARVLYDVGPAGWGRFAPVAERPGFVPALTDTISELRMQGLGPEAVAAVDADLARLLAAYEAALAEHRRADRGQVLALARAAVEQRPAAVVADLVGMPLLLLDLSLTAGRERGLVAALAGRAAEVLATAPAGDESTIAHLERGLGFEARRLDPPARTEQGAASALGRLQRHLFGGSPAALAEGEVLDGSVRIAAEAGEGRECVEIARGLLREAEAGTAFDQMAVLLRSPGEYRAHLAEVLERAGVPANFVGGVELPDPSGRAFVTLLTCAAERLSARRFAEYLSLGELPDATAAGEPPVAAPDWQRWVPPDEELMSTQLAEGSPAVAELRPAVGRHASGSGDSRQSPSGDPDALAVRDGTLRAPRRWERLIHEAAVVGSLARWRERLSGLQGELELKRKHLDDDGRAAGIERTVDQLQSLRTFCLPLLEELDALRDLDVTWGEWCERLSALASRSLRRPERVAAALQGLAVLAPVGPVSLEEVLRTLSPQLTEIAARSVAREGAVLVAPVQLCRGTSFEVVFVPGLAERLFPRRIDDDPLLPDGARHALDEQLIDRERRAADEKLALRLAAGCARRRLVLSYPAFDASSARERVPSFYGLEVIAAIEGRLPGFEELATGGLAEAGLEAPAGAGPAGAPSAGAPGEGAIDEGERELRLLAALRSSSTTGSQAGLARRAALARWLKGRNARLQRALELRARQWSFEWTGADGQVDPHPVAAAALAQHRLAARPYSASALQALAACPYRFYLGAILRLEARIEVDWLEELDPLQRGSLVHEVLYELMTRLQQEGLLPMAAAGLPAAIARAEQVLAQTAEAYREELAPAVSRSWDVAIRTIGDDLRELLRRWADGSDADGDDAYRPARFELGFGLGGAAHPEPVALDCGIRLRGQIDLVELGPQDTLQVTDYKTGGSWSYGQGFRIGGGEALQPVLYSLAAEKLFADKRVVGGRLYYCTTRGGFSEQSAPLDDQAREAAKRLAEAVERAVGGGFMPAAPAEQRNCDYCDYQAICGPYAHVSLRCERKPQQPLAEVASLRDES